MSLVFVGLSTFNLIAVEAIYSCFKSSKEPLNLCKIGEKHLIFYRAILVFWLMSYFFHSFGFHVLPISVVDSFSNFGFHKDVMLLREVLNKPDYAAAFAGHMIVSSLYMIVTVPLFFVLALKDALSRVQLLSDDNRVPVSFLVVCATLIPVGAYFILSDAHSSFANSDRRFRGMPLWWILFLTTCVWPCLLALLAKSVVDPKYLREHWKLRG